MAQQHGVGGGQFGDTTFTKVFVGGLAWETQRDTMRRHFEQFGDILEAVVISDKNTGRSKGYGFVTFRDAEAARRACADASPIIDGRRANCNLAALGSSRCRPSTPWHGHGFTITSSTFQYTGFQSGVGHGYPVAPALIPQPTGSYSIHQGFPYHTYFGYTPYSVDYSSYSPGYYGPYGGTHFPLYAGPGMISTPALYPYFHFAQAVQGNHGYPQAQSFGTLQLPQVAQYPDPTATTISSIHQQYQGMVSIPAVLTPTGMTLALALAGGVAGTGVSTQQYYEVHSAINQPGAPDSEHPSA